MFHRVVLNFKMSGNNVPQGGTKFKASKIEKIFSY